MHEHECVGSLREVKCGLCTTVFYVCRHCDHGQAYCPAPCQGSARDASRRKARRHYEETFGATLAGRRARITARGESAADREALEAPVNGRLRAAHACRAALQ